MELLGTDLPVAGAPPGTYAWQDGAFLGALKAGHWVRTLTKPSTTPLLTKPITDEARLLYLAGDPR